MKVYFLRHGIAGDRETWEGDDRLRPLTAKGIEQIKTTAKLLAQINLGVKVILSSPLTRALETAELTAKKLGVEVIVDERLSPGFSARELADLINEHADAEGLMVVGHEPDFSETISSITGGSEIVMKKGGLARVDIDHLAAGEGRLVWLIPPLILIR